MPLSGSEGPPLTELRHRKRVEQTSSALGDHSSGNPRGSLQPAHLAAACRLTASTDPALAATLTISARKALTDLLNRDGAELRPVAQIGPLANRLNAARVDAQAVLGPTRTGCERLTQVATPDGDARTRAREAPCRVTGPSIRARERPPVPRSRRRPRAGNRTSAAVTLAAAERS